MGIEKLLNASDHARFVALGGYAIVVYMHEGDCPSDLFIARCFEWAREYPFVRFAMIDTDTGCVGLDPIAFVPMATFFRNGKRIGSPLVGTDFSRMEDVLRGMRVDGGAIAVQCGVATQKTTAGIFIAPHVDRAIFPSHRK